MSADERAGYPRTLAAVVALVMLALAVGLAAQADLEYQSRGDRYEGIRLRPVSGYDIELLSALVDYQEPAPSLPDRLRARFFLTSAVDVYLTIRELDVTHYYWLDRVSPTRPWALGFANEFVWPTDAVLRKLPRTLTLAELAAVARLGRLQPSADERVAPVILYHTRAPKTVNGYVLAFKTSTDARLTYTIVREGEARPVAQGSPLRPIGGRPFVVHWDAATAPPGAYRVVLDGYALDTNQRLLQTVRFAHQPAVP